MVIKGYKVYKGLVFILLIAFFSACTDESLVNENKTGAFLSISGVGPMSATHPGTSEDYLVSTFRVMAFNKTTGVCVSNARYTEDQWTDNTVLHPIKPGAYNFVFLANEVNTTSIFNQLNAVSTYADLNNIAYPASAFSSEQYIPMIQEIENVTVLSEGKGVELGDGSKTSMLELALVRLGIRVDVVLEADDNFDAAFEGVTFSNIPDLVALTANYSGTIERNTIRKFTLGENADYFSDGTPSAIGTTWAKNVNRVILPSSNPVTKSEKSEAVLFTVNMGSNYSPSSELKIASNPVDYSLPANTKLDLTGIIRDALHMNIVASNWSEYNDQWIISGNKKLNVSHTDVSITDFNGARISFWSNMPQVKVLPEVFIGSGSVTATTEEIFNDLVLKAIDIKDNGSTITYATSRFSYTYDKVSKTGSGYMDILLDEKNNIGQNIYRIVLSAEDEYGGKLQKDIQVNTSQYGGRFKFADGTRYIGTFFRKNETGERIITGQLDRNSDLVEYDMLRTWKATVIDGDFVTLSSTPSFDPGAGTDNPGNPEKYPVIANEYKAENGRIVEGRGRVYFRLGLTSTHSGSLPRYAKVLVEYYGGKWSNETGGGTWTQKYYLYIRQGEEDDYILRPGTDDPIIEGVLKDQSRNSARKFSAFNLTAPQFKNGNEATNYQVGYKAGAFVEYPTQAGALFQWALPNKEDQEPYFRQAYHPTSSASGMAFWSKALQFLVGGKFFLPVWNTATEAVDPIYDSGYQGVFEVCPDGYHRPSDGHTDRISWNGPYPNLVKYVNGVKVGAAYVNVYGEQNDTIPVDHSGDIAYSEWRQSLFKIPLAGDAGRLEDIGGWDGSAEKNGIKIDRVANFWQNRDSTAEAEKHISFAFGFYADGYFDRRPVMEGANYFYGVSVGNAKVAYRGVLVYNENYNNASVFFPAAGRRSPESGELEYSGATGYYLSSSIGPSSASTPHSVWSAGLGKWPNPGLQYQLATFAESIRCVRDEGQSRRR